jgi:two-component system sensor histidine kinase CpxA
MKLNLLSKILIWVLINLLVLGVVLYFIFNLQFRFGPGSPLMRAAEQRLEIISALISAETAEKTRAERDRVLRKYSEKYGIEFTLFSNRSEQLGGKPVELPEKIKKALRHKFRPPPGIPQRPNLPRPPPGEQIRIERTSGPTTYWAIVRIPVREKGESEPIRASVVAFSGSMTGNGLFFDPKPWIGTILIILGVSFLIWFPFVRNLNKSISKLTKATEQISGENFNVRIEEKRSDEIGRLGRSINHLAERLAGFVTGQKRFLGDISHELNSPLARMNWALSILETRIKDEDQKYIEDIREEIQLMSKLVGELLSYSKAGLKGTAVRLEDVDVREIIEETAGREKLRQNQIKTDVKENMKVRANRKLLARALSNVISNAIRHGGEADGIRVTAEREKELVKIKVSDRGEGVPEKELSRIFDPLYRVEKDRARQTGGTGLGLAIVKTCVEACGGKVSAGNLLPQGFEVTLILNAVDGPAEGPGV